MADAVALAGKELPVVDAFSGPMYRGDVEIHYGFDPAFVPVTADVPHLRAPLDADERAFIANGGLRWPGNVPGITPFPD
jgi:hypothetical protein